MVKDLNYHARSKLLVTRPAVMIIGGFWERQRGWKAEYDNLQALMVWESKELSDTMQMAKFHSSISPFMDFARAFSLALKHFPKSVVR